MLQKIVHKVLEPRHFWRDIGFDELSEIYTNAFLRSLANSLVGIFVPIYLYKLGFSLTSVFGFLALWFLLRPLYDVVSGYIVARIGPKHALAIAATGQVIYLVFLMTLPTMNWPLWLVAQIGTACMSLHLIAFHTDFSKIKHTRHGGKEIGFITNLEKIGGVIGPLVGGLIANFFDPRYAIALAALLQLLAVAPLFATKEAVKTHQHITYRGLPWRRHFRDYLSSSPLAVENYVSLVIWPLFLAVVILPTDTYAKVGIMVGVATAISLFATHAIGKQIDDSKGRQLLRFGSTINAVVHFIRPLIGSFFGAFAVTVVNDPLTASYRMPYMKGLYDASDSVPGYRIAYLSSVMSLDSLSRFVFCVLAWLLSFALPDKTLFTTLFIIAGFCSLGIMLERFPSLNQRYTVDSNKG